MPSPAIFSRQFCFGMITSSIAPFFVSHHLFTTSYAIGLHTLALVICYRNRPLPRWLSTWDHWWGKAIVFSSLVTLSHIVVWVVLFEVEVVLRLIILRLEIRRLGVSFSGLVLLLLLPYIMMSIGMVLVRAFQRVRSLCLSSETNSDSRFPGQIWKQKRKLL